MNRWGIVLLASSLLLAGCATVQNKLETGATTKNDFWAGAEVVFGDCTNGYGKVIWPDGQPKGLCPGKTYEGYFADRLPNGCGKLFFPPTGCIYFGEFKNGKKQGIGTSRWPHGLGYTGEYKDGEPTGSGFSISPNGDLELHRVGAEIGLTLLANGNLEREDIYGIAPTADTNSPTGLFVPANLSGCFEELNKMLMTELIEKMRSGTEEAITQYHFELGMWMRNNWGLWSGSRLAKWFNAQGIQHPDDMSGIILVSFWRHLNKKPIKLDDQLKCYQEYWKKQETIQQDN